VSFQAVFEIFRRDCIKVGKKLISDLTKIASGDILLVLECGISEVFS
jgi:hypothetical protein